MARDFKREYKRRKEANRDVPPAVARGHGPIPIGVARKLEAGERLTAAERKEHRAGIKKYVAKYGPPGKGRKPAHRRFPERFDSEEKARSFVDEMAIPQNYVQVTHAADGWAVTVLR